MINENIIVGLLILFLVLILYYIYYSKHSKVTETFDASNFEDNRLLVKKTFKYNKVYTEPKLGYTIWEPEHIDNYFPVGHYYSDNKSPPKTAALLVKSLENSEIDKPSKYTIIAKTKGNMGIWKPLGNNGYTCLGYIFSKEEPSRHSIRCVKTENTSPSYLKNNIVNDNDYAIWKIEKSDLLLANNTTNSEIPYDSPVIINENNIRPHSLLRYIKTKKYTKVFSNCNETTNKCIHIWRPVSSSLYKSLGDIVLDNDKDPNDNLETIVIHKDDCKEPLNFGNNYANKFVSEDDKRYSFWKPKPPKGYVALGYVATKGFKEPHSNKIIACIPIEYTTINKGTCDLYRKMYWNNIPDNNVVSLWVDKSHRFMTFDGLKCEKKSQFVLNEALLDIKKDVRDIPRKAIIHYKINKNNVENYTLEDKKNFLIETLANRFSVDKTRFTNIEFDSENKQIYIKVDSRPVNSNQLSVAELVSNIRDTIQNQTIKVYKNDNYIIVLDLMEVLKIDNNKILLDNSDFIEETS